MQLGRSAIRPQRQPSGLAPTARGGGGERGPGTSASTAASPGDDQPSWEERRTREEEALRAELSGQLRPGRSRAPRGQVSRAGRAQRGRRAFRAATVTVRSAIGAAPPATARGTVARTV